MGSNKVYLTHSDIERMCFRHGTFLASKGFLDRKDPGNCYPIPRGGIPAAYAMAANLNLRIVDSPEKADFFFDDIIDSGATRESWCQKYPEKPFLALIDKTSQGCPYAEDWIVFPWEGDAVSGISDNIVRILQFIGENPKREGLLETPERVAKALGHWFSGYNKDPADLLKVFEDGGQGYDQMVLIKDIPIYSKCEHHMSDIFGTATVAYIPNGKIVGLSKVSRLADMYARRLQVQERLTSDIANALFKHLTPKGVGVMIKARHMCMESRGICQQGHHTVTTALKGVFLDEPATRAEFMALAGR